MAMLHVQAIGAAASPPAQVNDIADSPCQRRQPHIVFSPSLTPSVGSAPSSTPSSEQYHLWYGSHLHNAQPSEPQFHGSLAFMCLANNTGFFIPHGKSITPSFTTLEKISLQRHRHNHSAARRALRLLQIGLLQHRSLFEKETKVFILANFEVFWVFLKFPAKTETILLASQ
eukprot:scaffold134167_cov20-Cyclotella_meneghiniana.AAC.1